MKTLKQIVGSLALGAVLTSAVGVVGFAQDGRRNDQWEQRRNERTDDQNNDRYHRRRERRDDRYDRRQERRDDRDNEGYNQRNDRDDRYNRRNDGWGDSYGNNRYAQQEIAKGYRDGLDRGRKDAQTNRQRTPNNSSHYRDGNQYYRQGFERGFYEAYNQYSNNGRNRRW